MKGKANESVLKRIGMKRELLQDLKIRQIKYFGHIKRHDTLIKTLLEGKVEGRRAKSRLRHKWENDIKRWTKYSLAECNIRARDRGCWRSIEANLRCGDGTKMKLMKKGFEKSCLQINLECVGLHKLSRNR